MACGSRNRPAPFLYEEDRFHLHQARGATERCLCSRLTVEPGMIPTGETVSLNRPKASPSQRARGQAPVKRAERTLAEPKDVAVEDWENEGGQLRNLRSAAISPTDASQRARERPTPSAELAAMRTKFLADFAGGFVGQHHNTFQHRSRVLRQLTASRTRKAAV